MELKKGDKVIALKNLCASHSQSNVTFTVPAEAEGYVRSIDKKQQIIIINFPFPRILYGFDVEISFAQAEGKIRKQK